MAKKKSLEFSFVTFVILLITILVAVFFIARNTGGIKQENTNSKEENIVQTNKEENYIQKLYSKDVITIDEGRFSENWEIVDKPYGSILFYIQGPKTENEDGTFSDIRINFYMQESSLSSAELKTQMLEDSVYSKIEFTKMQEINEIQWMEFLAENEGVKAKILTLIKDGHMYAIEINGEEKIYDEYYNEAMKIAVTTKIAERISDKDASELIYKFDNIRNIKEGGTKFLLKSLNLPTDTEENGEILELPEEYKEEYIWTGVKYKDFEDEMTKYMTKEFLKEQFSEFVNYNDMLIIKDITGTQTDYMIEEIKILEISGNETTYEVTKYGMSTFMTKRPKITLKQEDGKLKVSNYVED